MSVDEPRRLRAPRRAAGAFVPAVALAVLCAESFVPHVFVESGEARAEAPDPTSARAQARFAAGTVLYNAADYRGAITEFEAGFAIAPRPAFLVNIGQAWRKL